MELGVVDAVTSGRIEAAVRALLRAEADFDAPLD
jgi:hypothetical protein